MVVLHADRAAMFTDDAVGNITLPSYYSVRRTKRYTARSILLLFIIQYSILRFLV
jgi:hypothetical protein